MLVLLLFCLLLLVLAVGYDPAADVCTTGVKADMGGAVTGVETDEEDA